MPKQDNPIAIQRRLMATYNISFVQPIETLEKELYPQSHSSTVSDIRQLGKTEFKKYHESIGTDSRERPWRREVRSRVQRIVESAQRCRDARKSEMGWRLTLEPNVLARFSVEVGCRRCRGRLWRSEQEVGSNFSQGNNPNSRAQNLKKRQERRTPCVCRSQSHREDPVEQGINPIFDDRADEAIVHPEEGLRRLFPKREERPDRVYGLRRTRRIERILDLEDRRPDADGCFIGSSVNSTPFHSDGEPLLFPFLVSEAKSEKSGSSWSDIEVQTSFAIRRLLLIQDGLWQAADREDNWEGGPLVNKGECWRVSIAYIDTNSTAQRFLITRLWQGSLDSVDDALQLLLIVDYICDWARDIYRESIIQCLRSLAVSNSRSLTYDTDIFSTIGRIDQWNNSSESSPASELNISSLETSEMRVSAYHAGLTGHHFLRDARHIWLRFISLYITMDNLQYFIDSTTSKREFSQMRRKLQNLLGRACLVRRDSLDALELSWTGKDREDLGTQAPDEMFFMVAHMSAYMNPQWQMTLELGYIAVSVDAAEVLQETVPERPLRDRLGEFPTLTGDLFPRLTALRERKPIDVLFACVERYSLSTDVLGLYDRSLDLTFFNIEKAGKMTENGVTIWRHASIILDWEGAAHNFISMMYTKHKTGFIEPSSPIFRVSSRMATCGNIDPSPMEHEATRCFWKKPGEWETLGVVYAVSKAAVPGNRKWSSYVNFMAFVLNPNLATWNPALKEYMKTTLPHWQFNVRRFDHGHGWSRLRNRRDIIGAAGFYKNMEGTYGISIPTETTKSRTASPQISEKHSLEDSDAEQEATEMGRRKRTRRAAAGL